MAASMAASAMLGLDAIAVCVMKDPKEKPMTTNLDGWPMPGVWSPDFDDVGEGLQ